MVESFLSAVEETQNSPAQRCTEGWVAVTALWGHRSCVGHSAFSPAIPQHPPCPFLTSHSPVFNRQIQELSQILQKNLLRRHRDIGGTSEDAPGLI